MPFPHFNPILLPELSGFGLFHFFPWRQAKAFLRVQLVTAFLGAFVQQTMVVVAAAPALQRWAPQAKVSTRELLLPITHVAAMAQTPGEICSCSFSPSARTCTRPSLAERAGVQCCAGSFGFAWQACVRRFETHNDRVVYIHLVGACVVKPALFVWQACESACVRVVSVCLCRCLRLHGVARLELVCRPWTMEQARVRSSARADLGSGARCGAFAAKLS